MSSAAVGHVHALPGIQALVDQRLESRYGTRFPLGVMAYVRLAPGPMM